MSDNGSAVAGNPAGNAGDPWYAGIADEGLRSLAQTKGWDTPEKALGSYSALEKHIGVPPERLLKLPEKPDDPAWSEVRAKVGFSVPDDPAQYELPVPDGFDKAFATEAATWFKDAGVPPPMAKALAGKWNEWTAQQIAAQDAAIERGVKESQAALRAEWGGEYEAAMTQAQRAAEALKADHGLSDEELKAMQDVAPRAYYKLLAAHGSTMGEARRVDGQSTGAQGQMTPQQAGQRLDELKANPEFATKVAAGDPESLRQMRELLAIKLGGG